MAKKKSEKNVLERRRIIYILSVLSGLSLLLLVVILAPHFINNHYTKVTTIAELDTLKILINKNDTYSKNCILVIDSIKKELVDISGKNKISDTTRIKNHLNDLNKTIVKMNNKKLLSLLNTIKENTMNQSKNLKASDSLEWIKYIFN